MGIGPDLGIVADGKEFVLDRFQSLINHLNEFVVG